MTSSSIPTEGGDSAVDSTTTKREDYFAWLCSRIDVSENHDYSILLDAMYAKEFVWVVGNDDNRIQDARDLRIQYGGDTNGWKGKVDKAQKVYGAAVSVLEVLIGVADRLGFLIDVEPSVCAWILIENLGLDRCHKDRRKIDEILDRLIWRNYSPNGSGGFFPLRNPSRDQRSVEIWYQMTEWIEENYNL